MNDSLDWAEAESNFTCIFTWDISNLFYSISPFYNLLNNWILGILNTLVSIFTINIEVLEVIKISEKAHLNEKIHIQTEQKLCSCGCKGQEKADFEEFKQKPITQSQIDSDK